jgi:GST-like protein
LVGGRLAVKRGMQVLTELRKPSFDATANELLFGASQYKKR